MNVRRLRRLGMVVVGLGVGAAIAATPGIAAADTGIADPVNWLAGIDPLSAATLAPASPLDLAISVDGFQLLDLGTTAVAKSGMGDAAIAFGPNSTAIAAGGFGDYATAGAGATAIAGATATTVATGNNFDFASASGIGSNALAGISGFNETTGSSFDYASANSGTNINALDGATAVAGDNGSGDSASAVGQAALSFAGLSHIAATPANFDSADVFGNLSAPTTGLTEAIAGGQPGIFGGGIGGSSDNAFVIDPLGTVGSTATAGLGNNFDLAGVFGDALHATATSGSNVIDLLPTLF
ncbi:hypothetical protein [Mycobacterium sp.]|uniref:hypothetical protein n=1 Tax=Mycobacterium sp. TaxID=1785 RepID=UPI003D0D61AB